MTNQIVHARYLVMSAIVGRFPALLHLTSTKQRITCQGHKTTNTKRSNAQHLVEYEPWCVISNNVAV